MKDKILLIGLFLFTIISDQVSKAIVDSTFVINDSNGLLRVASIITQNITSDSGIIINFTFSNISQSSPQGEYTFSLSNVVFGNIKAQSLSLEIIDGVFTLYKDGDCDGIIEDEDVARFIDR